MLTQFLSVAILALKVMQVWDMIFSIACNLMAYLSNLATVTRRKKLNSKRGWIQA
jgi:hypothetical protein